MTLYSVLLFFLCLLGAFFAVYVIIYGKERSSSIFLGLFNALFSLWCFGQFMGEMSAFQGDVLFWTRMNLSAAVFIPMAFLLFLYAFLGKLRKRTAVLLAVGSSSIVFFFFIPTSYFIESIVPTRYFRFYPKGGPVYLLFLVVFALVVAAGFYELFREYRSSSGTRRNQVLYIILASVCGFGGGIMWFLPAFGSDIYPAGIFIVPFYLFIAAYAIIKHNLLDINIMLKKGIGYSVLATFGVAGKKADAGNTAGLGVVAAAIAHEIKNPLTAIKGMVQVLPQNLSDREFVESFNDIVPRQIEKINASVERLLDFSRVAAAAGEGMTEPVGLEDIIDEILFTIRVHCEKTGVIINKTCAAPSKIRAEKEMLSQAFFNIIMNAVQAMPEGGELGISISGDLVDISDSGKGISKEDVGRIFEPFFSRRQGGSGMGLAIAAAVIGGFGGKIEVDSKMGRGTSFRISFERGTK